VLLSCKSNFEKLNIDDLKGNEKYQDESLSISKNFQDSVKIINDLIGHYFSMKSEGKEQNSKYNYCIARLYYQINNLNLNAIYDSKSKKLKDKVFYSNCYDSAYYFAEKSLNIDSNNIYAMYLLSSNFYFERQRFLLDKNEIPLSGLKNAELYNKRWNYILNNAIRFTGLDTTSKKYLSRTIVEIALYNLDFNISDNYNFDKNDENEIFTLVIYGKLYDYLSQFKDFILIKFDKERINKNVVPIIKDAVKEVERINKINSYKSNLVTKYFINGLAQTDAGNKKVYFKDDGTVEFNINTCDEGGYFGGGSSTGLVSLKGTFELINSSEIIVTLDKEFEYSCDNGYSEKWDKKIRIGYQTMRPGLADERPAFVIKEGVKEYATGNGRWREWKKNSEFFY